jgi:hypothetical protein
LASILTLWLPLILGEPSLLQPCEMHGAAVVASAEGAAMAHHASDAAGHASHHMSAAADHASDSHQQHTDCSCIGCCSSSSAVAASFDAPIAAVVVATYPVAPAPVEAAALPRPAPEFARPYTTGPPLA